MSEILVSKPGQAGRVGATQAPGGRIAYFEWARALGCIAILVLHTLTSSMTYYGDVLWVDRMMATMDFTVVACRWAVPVFLMVSGALMLDPAKEMTLARVWRHVRRMLVVLLTFGLVFCLADSWQAYGGFCLEMAGTALLSLASGQSWDHMWFVYALVALYLLTPLLHAFTSHASRGMQGAVIAVLFVGTMVMPTVNLALETDLISIAAPTGLFYYLFGSYAHRYLRLGPGIVVAGLVCLAAMVAGASWQVWGFAQVVGTGYEPVFFMHESFLTAVWSALVFLAFKSWLDRPVRPGGILSTLSAYSFAIYIVHPILVHVLYRLVMPAVPGMLSLPPVIFELACVAFVAAGTMALSWLARRVPVLRDAL